MPRLSIVIPCAGGAAEFDGTLVSVLAHRPPDAEVIVVHTEPYGDPYDLTGEVDFLQADGPHLVDLLNAGLERSSGQIVHVLGCGMEAVEGWTAAAVAHFDDPEVAVVSPLLVAGDGRPTIEQDGQAIVAAGVRWTLSGARRVVADRRLQLPGTARLRSRILGPTLAAGFYRREVLMALGGFDGWIGDAHADVELALAIRALGGLHICEPASLVHACAIENMATKRGFGQGRGAERLFWRYASSHGWPMCLALHALALAGELALAPFDAARLKSLAGRAAGFCHFGAGRRNEERLSRAEQRLAELTELRTTIRMPAKSSAAPLRRAA